MMNVEDDEYTKMKLNLQYYRVYSFFSVKKE